MALRAVRLALACAAPCGCIRHLGEEHSSVGELLGDCVVPIPAGVVELGAPVALEYPDSSLWLWDQVVLADGSVVSNVAAHVSSADELCGSGPVLLEAAPGQPLELLPLTPSELATNAAREDGRALALQPLGGFSHEGIGYLYYAHVLRGPGPFESQLLGTGLCKLSDLSGCVRVQSAESSILFPASERLPNQGGLVFDARALLFGCRGAGAFSAPCTINGAPLSELEDPAAYSYYTPFDGWLPDAERAAIVLDQPATFSISAYAGRFIAVQLDPFTGAVELRFADLPTGEFETPIPLLQAAATDGFTSGGREHSGLRQGTRRLHVSYFTPGEGAAHGLHLARFELNRGLQ